MNELIMSTAQKTEIESDPLSNNSCCQDSWTVIPNAHGLIEKHQSSPFIGNKNEPEQALTDDAQEGEPKHAIRAKIT